MRTRLLWLGRLGTVSLVCWRSFLVLTGSPSPDANARSTASSRNKLVKRAAAQGVLMNAPGKRTLPSVTHLDLTHGQPKSAAELVKELIES